MRAQAFLVAIACLFGSTLAGCNRPAVTEKPPVGAVAVIDLDAIAQRLGSDKQIAESITKRQTSLSQQLVDLAKSYNQQIADQKQKLAEAAAAEQGDVTLANWQQQANANLNKVKQQAELDLQKHKAQLIAQFRDEIKPAARRVAQERGLSVIVTKNDAVLYDFAPAADITEAVVNDLLAHRTAVQSTPIQK